MKNENPKLYDSIAQMEPLMPDVPDRDIEDLAVEVIRKSAALSNMLHPMTRESVTGLLREMNSYYSNLIEGHRTHPAEIQKALKQDYSHDADRRALQQESVAHIQVQQLVSERIRSEPTLNICSSDFLCWVHKEFYDRVPHEFRIVTSLEGKREEVIPGEFRKGEVVVGRHVPPTFLALPAFLTRFAEYYEPSRQNAVNSVLATAASHHRLAWIHPFLDGNGRVCRIYTDAYLVKARIDGHGLWTMSRGLARHRDEYMSALTWGDAHRQNDLDGRGNLSKAGLLHFCKFFLNTAIDQIQFMTALLDLDGLQNRIKGYVEFQANIGEMKPEAGHILREVLLRGEVPRGEVPRVAGMPERSARIVLKQLLDKDLLVSDSPKSSVRLGLPTSAIGYYFPQLYPEGVESPLTSPGRKRESTSRLIT